MYKLLWTDLMNLHDFLLGTAIAASVSNENAPYSPKKNKPNMSTMSGGVKEVKQIGILIWLLG